MKTQNIINLLNDINNESSEFETKIWYACNDQNNTEYGEEDENNWSIKFKTKGIKWSLCDYSDAYILVTGDITAADSNENINFTFKNCASFTRYVTHINDEHIDTAKNLDIIMLMYNLTEYSDNYSDTSESLFCRYFKKVNHL